MSQRENKKNEEKDQKKGRNLVSASVERKEKKKKKKKWIWCIWANVILIQFFSFWWGDSLWLGAIEHHF